MDSLPEPRQLLPAIAFLGVFELAGCSVLVDANRPQCSTNADCTARGAAFADTVCNASGLCEGNSQWSCDAVLFGDAPGYQATLHLEEIVDSAPVVGVAAQLCRRLDVSCDNPVISSKSDSDGLVVMQIEAGFDGYVQLTDSKQITPSMYFLTPPTTGDLDVSVRLTNPLVAAGIVASAGGSAWLPDRGIILLNAFDCQGNPAADISYSIDSALTSDTFIFYLVNALPTTSVMETDYTGYGGLVNMPSGVTTISAVLAPSGRQVSKLSVLVRAGYVSYSSVTPNSL
jgi:hypothetical protein